MGPNGEKIVDFATYCHRCKHFDKDSTDDPCNECLGIPARQYSNKPEYYEEKTK